MVEVTVEPGDDVGQLQAVAVCDDWDEMLPFLKLADVSGVTAHVAPTHTASTQQAREIRFDLDDMAEPGELAGFVCAFVALAAPMGSDGIIRDIGDGAKRLRERCLP